jgi:conjugative relaxase-like TrwC/TraI family protein
MLRINESRSAVAAKQYFDRALRHADYYQDGIETPGAWYGRGAARLGLTGAVTREAFQPLIENRHPLTGDKLTPRQKVDRRVGADFTFNAPKSVSLLYGLTGDERILEAFRKAVIATMGEIERDVKTRVRVGGRNEDRVTGNLVWAEFLHTTARPVDGVPDPHLHTHAYAMNLTHDGKEGRWKAAQLGGIFADRPYYEAVFLSRLARYMRGLGFGIERHGKYWDLAGISRATIERFSRRTAEIEAAARELGITNPDTKATLGATTREKKRETVSDEELRDAWRRRLSARERAELDGMVAAARLAAGSRERSTARDAVAFALGHTFERASVAHERRLLAEALYHSYGQATPEEVVAAVERMELVHGQVSGRRVVTTRAVLAEEERMIALARRGRLACRPLRRGTGWAMANGLNQEQRAAVAMVWSSPDRVMVVRGGAGTGKTTLMRAAVAGIEAEDRQVAVFAPTGAARDVLRKDGFAGADTLQRLLADAALQRRLGGDAVVWVDEAGLVSVPDMARLLALAEQRGWRLVLSGDSRQHAAVARGDALRLLEQRAGVRPAELTAIVRQRGTYREAVSAIAAGDMEKGWRLLTEMGAVLEVGGEERLAALANDYMSETGKGREVLVVAPTHAEKDAVTAAVRERLDGLGLLGPGEDLVVLRDLRWTEAERGDARRYQAGMVVKFTQNAPGLTKGARLAVASVGAEGNVALRVTLAQQSEAGGRVI